MSNIRSGVLAALLVAAAAACSGKSGNAPLGDDLAGDLDAARSSAVQLAPNSARGTDVVSAEELTGAGEARERTVQKAPRVAVRKAPVARTPTVVPTASAEAPVVAAPTPEASDVVNADTLAPIDPRPAPAAPAATPARRGGDKSVGDVIRDAPFPINP